MGGFSKAYAMTGWRVGWLCAPAGDPRGHRQGPPVRDHVGPDDRPGRGARGARPTASPTSSGCSPSTTAAAACSSTGSTRSACARSSRGARSTPSPRSARTGLDSDDVRRAAARRGTGRGRARGAPSGRRARATSGCATRRPTSSSRRRSAGSAGSWSGTAPSLSPDPARPAAGRVAPVRRRDPLATGGAVQGGAGVVPYAKLAPWDPSSSPVARRHRRRDVARLRRRTRGARPAHPRRGDPTRRRSTRPARSSPGSGSGCSCAGSPCRSAGSRRDLRALSPRRGARSTDERGRAAPAPRRGAPAGSTVLERYEPVIGIEVHCQLRTASKMFCGCSTAYDGAPPNTHTCPVCLGLPGALPTINRRAVEHVLATGLAIDATTPPRPAGTARTTSTPTCRRATRSASTTCPSPPHGRLTFETSRRAVRRSGSPAPTSRRTRPSSSTRPAPTAAGSASSTSTAPARRSWRSSPSRTSGPPSRPAATPRSSSCCSARSACPMPTWSAARCGSRPTSRSGRRGTEPFGTRVEVKNMNSFRAVERAIAYEIERQAAALDAGETAHPGDPRLGRRAPARRTSCGPRRTRTTTATSRSRTCRRSGSIRPGWRRSGRALPELPAARARRYQDELGPVGLRRRRDRRRPGHVGRLRGDPAPPARTCRPRRSPTSSPATTAGRPRPSPIADADGLVGRAGRRAGRPRPADRRRRDQPGATPRGPRRPPRDRSRRSAPIVAARGFRQISDADALGRGRRRGARRRTRRPSPTTGPASRRSASSSARS